MMNFEDNYDDRNGSKHGGRRHQKSSTSCERCTLYVIAGVVTALAIIDLALVIWVIRALNLVREIDAREEHAECVCVCGLVAWK
jgi:hypothetical protein